MRTLSFIIALATTAALSSGDTIHLTDGRTLTGDVKRTPDGWTVVADGQTLQLTNDQVKSIEVGSAEGGATGDAGLASLRRSTASATDPKTVIDKYERFITAAKGKPVAEVAKVDLRIWKDRADRGLVKFGDKWLTPAEADQAKSQFDDRLIEARDHLLQGRTTEASKIIDAVLSADAQQPAALYLRGVLAFGTGDVPAARKAFDAAANALGRDVHGPTLNNLAVVMMRQNQTPAALNTYGRALTVAPEDMRILDNVAEALQANSRDNKLAGAVKKLAATFSPLDMALAKRMASEGFFRWGATWVPQDQFQHLQAMERQVNEQIAVHEREFTAAQGRVRAIDDEVAANERSMRRIEANSVFRDETGQLVRVAYPPAYFELQRSNQELATARQKVLTEIEQIRVAANQTKAKLPTPRYTGAQRLIGPEGTPNLPPVPAEAPPQAAAPSPADPAAAPPPPPQPLGPPPPASGTQPAKNPPLPNPGPPPRSQLP
ncbi:MAG TPA: hypothetical protein VGN72_23125 [Tepidisphaeraceae bacterium]|jgi:hypothetical protein|nr:hypothetical protein [Tepidisphaeraceae bacterium]